MNKSLIIWFFTIHFKREKIKPINKWLWYGLLKVRSILWHSKNFFWVKFLFTFFLHLHYFSFSISYISPYKIFETKFIKKIVFISNHKLKTIYFNFKSPLVWGEITIKGARGTKVKVLSKNFTWHVSFLHWFIT